MARHTTKQVNTKYSTFNAPKFFGAAAVIICLIIVIRLLAMLTISIRAENRFLGNCKELQEYGLSKEACRQIVHCARDKVGYKTMLKYDEDKLYGYEKQHVTGVITKCTWQAMIDELED